MRPDNEERRPTTGAAPRTDGEKVSTSVGDDADLIVQPMPDLSPEEYDALRGSIREHGVRQPVTIDQHGRIIDGNNRFAIAAELGIDCPTIAVEVADDDAAVDLALELNCQRRHLTQEQKRELIRNELVRRPDDSDRAIGRRVGCDHKTVGAVRRNRSTGEFPQSSGPLSDAERVRLAEAEASIETARHHLVEMRKNLALACWEAMTNAIPAHHLALAVEVAARTTERDCGDMGVPEAAQMFRDWVFDPVIASVNSSDWAEETRPHWDHETFLPLTLREQQDVTDGILSIAGTERRPWSA